MKLTIERRQAADYNIPFWGLSDGTKFYEFGREETMPDDMEQIRSQWQEFADKYGTLPLAGTLISTCGPDISKN